MSPADDNSFATTHGNKKATYTLICIKIVELVSYLDTILFWS